MAAPVLSQRVSLSVSCTNLPDADVGVGLSDPFCVLFMRTVGKNTNWVEVGHTERIKNTLSPTFVKSFEVDYFFEQRQELRFAIYDVDDKFSAKLEDQDFLGEMVTEMGEICGSKGMRMTRPLKKKSKEQGTITVCAEEIRTATQDSLHLTLSARGLDKKDFMGLLPGDPFFIVHKSLAGGGWAPLFKSDWIGSTTAPEWKPVQLHIRELCNGELDRPIRFEVWDWDDNGGHDLIGACETTTREVMEKRWGAGDGAVLVNPKKRDKHGADYKGSGFLQLRECKVERVYSFLDYLAGGCEISLIIAVDFTGSNGDPRTPESLHHMGGQTPNQYVQALTAVGEILSHYDTDKLFHAYGFGGCLPGALQASHCFALNGQPASPAVPGVNGVIAAYVTALNSVGLSGPTFFAPTIEMAASVAAANRLEGQKYYILLIITDGALNDLEATKEAIVKAAGLPLSIIIVGVGDADFGNMAALDGDTAELKAKAGGAAKRDIVQFVPFRDFRGQHPQLLAAAVLAEVPKQLCEYFKLNNIAARPPLRPPQGPPGQPGYPHGPAPGKPPGPAPPTGAMGAIKI